MIALLLAASLAEQFNPVEGKFASAEELKLEAPALDTANWTQFAPVEITVPLTGTWSNPFDPTQIEVRALAIASDESYAYLPGFLDQDFVVTSGQGGTYLAPSGPPTWKIRFAPWRDRATEVTLEAIDSKSRARLKPLKKAAEKASGPGFAFTPKGSKYFTRGGTSFLPVGVTLAHKQSIAATVARIEELARQGVTLCRLVVSPDWLGLEWTSGEGYFGLGKYNLQNAWRMDRILDAAAKSKICVLFTLGNSEELDSAWNQNPYSSAKGGPCAASEDFWTNLKARIQYKKKLRYWVARINGSPSAFGFESYESAPAYWSHEMAEDIRDLHVYGIPFGAHLGDTTFWNLDAVGFRLVTAEFKDSPSATFTSVVSAVQKGRDSCGKPVLVLMVNAPKDTGDARIANWASLASGGAGGVLFADSPTKDWSGSFAVGAVTSKYKWHERKFELQTPTVASGFLATGIADENAGLVFVYESTEPEQKTVTVAVRRGGTYVVEWLDPSTGGVSKSEEVRAQDSKLTLVMPNTGKEHVFLYRRK